MKTKNIFVVFALVFIAIAAIGCGGKRAKAKTVAAPLPVNVAGDRTNNSVAVTPLANQLTAVPEAATPQPQAEPQQPARVIGDVIQQEKKTTGKVEIPTNLPGQAAQMTTGQIVAATQAIAQKLQNNPQQLEEFNRKLAAIGSDERPQLESLIKANLTQDELDKLKVVELLSYPSGITIVRTPPEDVSKFKELHLGRYPVTRGKPFTSLQQYKDDAQTIISKLQKLAYPREQLDAAAEMYRKCMEGSGEFWKTNPLWKEQYCGNGSADQFPYVEQTTGGFNTKDGRETGVTFKVKCVGDCKQAWVFWFYEPKFRREYMFYNICRGNPAVPLQVSTYQVTRREALCRAIDGPSVITQRGQVLQFRINSRAATVTGAKWYINDVLQPETGLEVAFPESKFPRGRKSVIRFEAQGLLPAEPGVIAAQSGKMECQTEVENKLQEERPIPVCNSLEVAPKEVTPDQSVQFRVNLTTTGREFVPVVLMDGREVYRGQPTTTFTGVELKNLFKAGEEASHSFEFRAFDPSTGKPIPGMECPGGVGNKIVHVRPKECPCSEITGDSAVRANHPARLHVKHDCTPHRKGYWKFQGTSQSITAGADSLDLSLATFATVFGHEPKQGGEQVAVVFIDLDETGNESLNPRCSKLITFYPTKPKKHHGICGPGAAYCWVPPVVGCVVATIITKHPCGFAGKIKYDAGRIGVNGKTLIDARETTSGKMWRYVRTVAFGPSQMDVFRQQLRKR